MDSDTEPNISSPSTTTRWKYIKIEVPPTGPRDSRPKGVLPPLSRSAMREPLTITTRLRGGPELWWELRARGRVFRVPGSLALHDVMEWIHSGQGGTAP